MDGFYIKARRMELIKSKIEYFLRRIFELGVAVKGLNGIWETLAGLSVLIIGRAKFASLFSFLARGELVENPHDRIISTGVQALHNFSIETKTFVGLYLLIHGVINIFLAIQLYRNKLWSYLVTIAAMVVFIAYQIHRINLYHSRLLIGFTILDVIFVFLTWHEYRYQKSLPVEKRAF